MDPHATAFSPQGCRTYHDLIRFTHELAVQEMFGLAEATGRKALAVKVTTHIPLVLYALDLGGGLKEGLSTCDQILPDHFASVPMKAIWKGFTHPGITWSGSINFDMGKFMTLMASGATSEFGQAPGGDSYALLSRDYLNFSAKFGYHFATVDTLCGEQSSQNYIALQFSGGAGNFHGRSLRVWFLAQVLEKLGFEVSVKGDLLEATLLGYDSPGQEEKLDQLGRLLASSRLLDMALATQGDVSVLTEKFFRGDYDFLSGQKDRGMEGFYLQAGDWEKGIEENQVVCLLNCSQSGYWLSSGLASMVGKWMGPSLQEFLDNLEAFYFFPLAIAKESEIEEGNLHLQVKLIKGNIDQAGGIAFGIKNAGNYFAFRINALEDKVMLFEFVNHKRFLRASSTRKIASGRWYNLRVDIKGTHIRGLVDDDPILEYQAGVPLKGYAGLWSKADSVTTFKELVIESKDQKRIISC
jgi:pyruvate,water dikinase